MLMVRYFDVVLILAAAPIMLLIGVPAVGYGVGVGTWIALRFVGAVVERYAAQVDDQRVELPLRLGYLIGRLFALAMAVILVRKGSGQDDGLSTLVVIVVAFTVQLVTSIADRPRRR